MTNVEQRRALVVVDLKKGEKPMIDDTDFLKSMGLFDQTPSAAAPDQHDDVVHADHTDGHIDH